MKNKILLTAAILMAAFCVNAQNKSAGINLSLWKGVSTQPVDSLQTTYLNIGLLSTMNRVKGLGINAISSVVRQDLYGAQISGFANIVGGSMNGIQISGLTNVNGDNMLGLSATGLVNIAGNKSQGVLISGLTNVIGDNSQGILVSGVLNITGDVARGIHVAGLANITGSEMTGVILTGLLSVTGENMTGVQISGIGNVIGEEANGVQLSLLNYATRVNGLQIGLINYYRDKMDGFQLGLVNLNPDTRYEYMIFGGNATKINAGVRFKNKLFYTILGAGTHYLDFDDKFSASAFYRGGLWLPLHNKLSISGDLGYQHIETFNNKKQENIPARLYALQGRINLEYDFTNKFGIIVSGGYGLSRHYNKSKTFDKGIIAEAGIVLR